MVKKIAFLSDKNDDTSISNTITTTTTTPPSQPTVIVSREVKHVQTNTDPHSMKLDRGTSYENDIQLVTSSSQTLDSSANIIRQTKAAQTSMKSLRDQSIETSHRGLFVCDLSSLLKSNLDETSSSVATAPIKRRP
jgi:NACalpha-BTF3-like transcription factor